MSITYDQVKEYCCKENGGDRELIAIKGGQEIKRNAHTHIEFRLSKDYNALSIVIKPKRGTTPDALQYIHLTCQLTRKGYKSCEYSFIDQTVSGSANPSDRIVTITAENNDNPKITVSAQTEVTVQGLENNGGGGRIHHCGVNETYNATSRECEPKGGAAGGGGSDGGV